MSSTPEVNESDRTARRPERRHKAGALDIRNIIGGLLGLYGVILTLMGIFGDEETDKTGGWNANLWAGLVLLAIAAFFLVWARLKPIVVPEVSEADRPDGAPDQAAG